MNIYIGSKLEEPLAASWPLVVGVGVSFVRCVLYEWAIMNDYSALKRRLLSSRLSSLFKATVALSLFIALACGGKKATRKSGLGSPGDYQGGAGGYFLSDKTCLDNSTHQVVSTYLFRMWSGSEVGVYKYVSPLATASASLSNDVISETVINLHEASSICLDQGTSSDCSEGTKIISKPVLLPICQDAFLFPRQSFEGVAISSAVSISRSFEFYKTVESQTLPKVSLVVLPLLEKSYISSGQIVRSDFELNNLAYVESFLAKPAFVILPTSQERQPLENLMTLNLWESSWTLAHEFGHHVLATISGVNKSALLVKDDVKRLNDNRLNGKIEDFSEFSVLSPNLMSLASSLMNQVFDIKLWAKVNLSVNHLLDSGPSTEGVRQVTNIDVWSGINEGFADLYATAASSGGQLTQGVPCIAVSRNPDNANFLTGEPKVLDESVLRQFYSSTVLAQPQNCSAPWFQGPHSIGAVIAHGLRKLSNLQGQSSVDFGRSLMVWARGLGRLAKGTPNLALSELTWEGIRSVLQISSPNANLNMDQCQSIYGVFPVWFEQWRAAGTLTCQ